MNGICSLLLYSIKNRIQEKSPTYLSANPPSHKSDTTIGSNISSLPEIVRPSGPLKKT
jgi:hypothetical protein